MTLFNQLQDASQEFARCELKVGEDGRRYWINVDPLDPSPFGEQICKYVDRLEFDPKHKKIIEPTVEAIQKRESEFRARAHAYFADRGYIVYRVDRFTATPRGGFKSDLFGIFDSEAFKGLETVGIQFTSKANLGSHITKMCAHVHTSSKDKTWRSVHLRRWLESGRKVAVLGFFKSPGSRNWSVEVRWVTLDTMAQHEPKTRKKVAT